jgi:hypothetical protein
VSGIYGFSYSSKTLAQIRKSNDINKHLVKISTLRIGSIYLIGGSALAVAAVMIEIYDAPNGINHLAFLYLLCIPGFVILGVGIFLYKVLIIKWIKNREEKTNERK